MPLRGWMRRHRPGLASARFDVCDAHLSPVAPPTPTGRRVHVYVNFPL